MPPTRSSAFTVVATMTGMSALLLANTSLPAVNKLSTVSVNFTDTTKSCTGLAIVKTGAAPSVSVSREKFVATPPPTNSRQSSMPAHVSGD